MVNSFCTLSHFPFTEARLVGCLEIPAHIPLQAGFLNDSNDLCYAPLHWQKFLPPDCVFNYQFLNLGIMLPLISPYHHPHIQPSPVHQGMQSALLVCLLLATAQRAYGFLIPASFMAGHICVSPSMVSQVSLSQPRQLKPRMARLHQSGRHDSDIQWKK